MSKRNQFVDTALSQVGYKEGKNNNNKYGSYFGHNNVSWCAYFVDWCADQVGILKKSVPYYPGCGSYVKWYQDRKQWLDGSLKPKKGYLILFKPTKKGATASHIGIVTDVDSSYVYTVEGNAGKNSDGVYKFKYKIGNSKILGYGMVDFGDEEKTDAIYQTYDCNKKKWLPNVVDDKDYAGNLGHNVGAVYINLTKGNVKYRVHQLSDNRWLPTVTNRDDFAGNKKAIDGIQIKSEDCTIKYRVHIKHGDWLAWVDKWDNTKNGYAGIIGKEIDAIQIKIN